MSKEKNETTETAMSRLLSMDPISKIVLLLLILAAILIVIFPQSFYEQWGVTLFSLYSIIAFTMIFSWLAILTWNESPKNLIRWGALTNLAVMIIGTIMSIINFVSLVYTGYPWPDPGYDAGMVYGILVIFSGYIIIAIRRTIIKEQQILADSAA